MVGHCDAVAGQYALCQLSTVGGGDTGNHARGGEVNRKKLFYDHAVRVYRLN